MMELRNQKSLASRQDAGTSSHSRAGKFGKGKNPPTSGSCPFFLEGRERDRSGLVPQAHSLAEDDAYTERRAVMLLGPAGSQGSWDHFQSDKQPGEKK